MTKNEGVALGVGSLLLIVLLGLGHQAYRNHRLEAERKVQAKELVEEIAGRYPEELKGDEREMSDPWGRHLDIRKIDGVFEGYVVKSAGPDGKVGTKDDISASHYTNIRVDKAGEKFGKATGDFGVGAAKGIYNSVKDHLSGGK